MYLFKKWSFVNKNKFVNYILDSVITNINVYNEILYVWENVEYMAWVRWYVLFYLNFVTESAIF